MGPNEMTEAGELNLVLSRRFGIQVAPAQNMATEFFPNIIMESESLEWGFLGGRKYLIAFNQQNGVAAETQALIFTNPAGSGVIAVITKAIFGNEGADETDFGWAIAAPTSFGRGVHRDSRLMGNPITGPSGVCTWGARTNAAATILNRMGRCAGDLADGAQPVEGFVIAPGGRMAFSPVSQDINVRGTIWWYERVAAADELRGALSQI